MKKKITFLLLLILIVTSGCSISRVRLNSADSIIDEVLLNDNKLRNTAFNGYSYYVPNTLKILNKTEYNTLLQDEYGNDYYVYVDAVGYYNKSENTFKEDKRSYYSKKIEAKNKKKNGYLEINEINNKYFVEAVYNYGKIEVYTKKRYLNSTLINLSQVLSSLKYNNKVLSTIIGDNVINYEEENFNIFTTKKSTTNYLDYIEQYDKVKDDNNKLPDDDQLDIGSDE